MTNVSTNATLFLKFAFPICWIIFFGMFTLAAWTTEMQMQSISKFHFQIGATLFFLLGITFLYWSMLRLKRVEMDGEFVYVTNYFKTFRYPWHNIKKIDEKDYLLFRTINIHFLTKSYFGKQIFFVVSQKRMNEFLAAHPDVMAQFLDTQKVS